MSTIVDRTCFFDVNFVVNNIKTFRVATEMQQWVPFLLFSDHKILRNSMRNINVLLSSREAPDVLSGCSRIWIFSVQLICQMLQNAFPLAAFQYNANK
jgi:hypothetical protein